MTTVAVVVLLGAILVGFYTYVGYPLILKAVAALRGRSSAASPDGSREWPLVSFSIPAYNEESEIAALLESILAIDYPEDRKQIVVVSDASTDRTDEIVRSFGDRGVELVRLPERSGKTAAEAAAAQRLQGDIVVNTDASIRIAPDALKPLIAWFDDPAVGVASGCDVSVARVEEAEPGGEAAYVGYEMAIRDAETRVRGIVGSSGCFYAIRRELHTLPLPDDLSRDFASALHAEEHGFRAVSVPDAVCFVPRTVSIQKEYRRKVRTIERGMHTLLHKRHLLNPFRNFTFAWMLFSHKICRWMLPWVGAAALVALAFLATRLQWALLLFLLAVAGILTGALGWWLGRRRRLPPLMSQAAFGLMGNVAAARAFIALLQGQRQAIWEPTRREAEPAS